MSVIRTKRTDGFTIVPNDALRDSTLSWAAKGLLALMLSYPNDWRYSLKHLTTISRTGLHGTRTAFQELEAAGYVTRTLTQDDSGVITGYEYVVRDDKHTVVRKSDDGEDEHRRAVYRRRNSPTTEKPHATKTERPTKTESTKTVGQTKSTSNVSEADAASQDNPTWETDPLLLQGRLTPHIPRHELLRFGRDWIEDVLARNGPEQIEIAARYVASIPNAERDLLPKILDGRVKPPRVPLAAIVDEYRQEQHEHTSAT